MRIEKLTIENFRGIQYLDLDCSPNLNVITGPNGSGKTSFFDAIRLFKIIVGEYFHNEHHQFLQEFNVNVQSGRGVDRFFYSTSAPIGITARLSLSTPEQQFIRSSLDSLIEQMLWKHHSGPNQRPSLQVARSFSTYQGEVDKIDQNLPEYRDGILKSMDKASFDISVCLCVQRQDDEWVTRRVLSGDTKLAQVIFSTFSPSNLGVIEFHPANRSFQRSDVGSNVRLFQESDQRAQHLLVQAQQKFQKIKQDLIDYYIQRRLTDISALGGGEKPNLIDRITQLFSLFLDQKKFIIERLKDKPIFLGVQTSNGNKHDIDELSAGEKEIIFGYAQRFLDNYKSSVFLIDEPELHLHPSMCRKLIDYYRYFISDDLQSQIFLVTHSDYIVRQAFSVNSGDISVSLLRPPESGVQGRKNQAHLLSPDSPLRTSALFNIVGDLGPISSGKDVLIVEGDNSQIDKFIIESFFPNEIAGVHIQSAASRKVSEKLLEVLSDMFKSEQLAPKISAITDRDAPISDDRGTAPDVGRLFRWDAYHVENYLIDFPSIVDSLAVHRITMKEEEVRDRLFRIASAMRDSFTRDIVGRDLHRRLRNCLRINPGGLKDNRKDDSAKILIGDLTNSIRSIEAMRKNEIDDVHIEKMFELKRKEVSEWLDNRDWIYNFPGRTLLSCFFAEHRCLRPDAWRDTLIDKIKVGGRQPPRMLACLREAIGAGAAKVSGAPGGT